MPFPTTQQVNLPACSPHCLFNAERQAGKLLSHWFDPTRNQTRVYSSRDTRSIPLDHLSCYLKRIPKMSCTSFSLEHFFHLNDHTFLLLSLKIFTKTALWLFPQLSWKERNFPPIHSTKISLLGWNFSP